MDSLRNRLIVPHDNWFKPAATTRHSAGYVRQIVNGVELYDLHAAV